MNFKKRTHLNFLTWPKKFKLVLQKYKVEQAYILIFLINLHTHKTKQ